VQAPLLGDFENQVANRHRDRAAVHGTKIDLALIIGSAAIDRRGARRIPAGRDARGIDPKRRALRRQPLRNVDAFVERG